MNLQTPTILRLATYLSLVFVTLMTGTVKAAETQPNSTLTDRQRLLEAVQTDQSGAADLLTEALNDQRETIHRTAAHLLGTLGEAGKPGLKKALNHPNPSLRLIAIDTLADQNRLTEYWDILLLDRDPAIQRKVKLDLIPRFPLPEGEEFIRLLDRLVESHHSMEADLRIHLMRLLASFAILTPQAQEAILAGAADADDAVRSAALQAAMVHAKPDWPGIATVLAAASDDQSLEIRGLGEKLHWKLLEVETIRLRTGGWRFKEDPQRVGRKEHWYAPDFDTSDWSTEIRTEASWQDFLDEEYFGTAWYRTNLPVPDLSEWDQAIFEFEGVDEEAWVWLNGEFLGSHEMGVEGWDVPFSVDATKALKPGKPNTLVVMARNTQAGGGIWRPVTLRIMNTARLQSGSF